MKIWDLLLAVPIRQLIVSFDVFFCVSKELTVVVKVQKQTCKALYTSLHCDDPIDLFQNFTFFHLNLNWYLELFTNSP